MKNKIFKGFILFISIFLLGTSYLYAEEVPGEEESVPKVVVEEVAPSLAPVIANQALATEPPVSELQIYIEDNMSGLVVGDSKAIQVTSNLPDPSLLKLSYEIDYAIPGSFILDGNTGMVTANAFGFGRVLVYASVEGFPELTASGSVDIGVVPTSYSFISGYTQTYTGNENGVTFVADISYDQFIEIAIDGFRVAPENYSVSSGSTIIFIPAAYLDTLEDGRYELSAFFNYGIAAGEIIVARSEAPAGTQTVTVAKNKNVLPKTGGVELLAPILLGLGMTGLVFSKKKK